MNDALPQSADEMTDILDIASMHNSSLPALVREILLGTLVVLVVLLVSWMIYRFIKYLKTRKKALTPEEKILKCLDLLRRKDYLHQTRFDLFYFDLDEAFRKYLDEKFEKQLLDKTYEELKILLPSLIPILGEDQREWYAAFLERSQMAKFSGLPVDMKHADSDFRHIERFVLQRKRLTTERSEAKQK